MVWASLKSAVAIKKAKSLKFALTEDGRLVRALLSVDDAPILDFENEEAPIVTVRHPIAREHELLDHATYWSNRNPEMGDATTWLKRYVGSREKDLVKEILGIRKSLRKVVGIMRNAATAKKLMKNLRK